MKKYFIFITLLLFTACNDKDTDIDTIIISKLNINTTWQWQLSGNINTNYDVDLYDVDLYDTNIETIKELKNNNKIVICYFSAGSYENWRDDKLLFNVSELGNNLDGWEDEKWLNINSLNVKEIMKKRIDFAKEKGCDGIEPDNVDGYINNTGFNLTFDEQITFNTFLSNYAHSLNLLIGLKNDLEQANKLKDIFDFSITEQCFEFNECNNAKYFTDINKPVFNAEYILDNRNNNCIKSLDINIRTLYLPLELDDEFRYSCDL
jgi:hypothetical protein